MTERQDADAIARGDGVPVLDAAQLLALAAALHDAGVDPERVLAVAAVLIAGLTESHLRMYAPLAALAARRCHWPDPRHGCPVRRPGEPDAWCRPCWCAWVLEGRP